MQILPQQKQCLKYSITILAILFMEFVNFTDENLARRILQENVYSDNVIPFQPHDIHLVLKRLQNLLNILLIK